MSTQNTPQFITADTIPEGGTFRQEPQAESIPVKIEVSEALIGVRHGVGETAVKHLVGQPVPVEPQPWSKKDIVPTPADPSRTNGYNGTVIRPN